MPFVTAEDFNVRPYKLPNLDDEQELAEFNTFVEGWEAEWLPKIFGQSFYNIFAEEVAALPAEWDEEVDYEEGDEVVFGVNVYGALLDNTDTVPEDVSTITWELLEEGHRWLKIIKGAEYTLQIGGLQKWVGLMDAEKFGVYSAWVKANVNHNAGVGGTVVSGVQNTDVISSAQNISSAWNKFARLIGGRTCHDKYNTLYGYLIAESAISANIFDDTFDETFYDTFGVYLKRQFGWPGRLNRFNI